ncbi:MAG: biotin-dependent carboxyltransferase family protein [Proteobacteria bacterium]|nr:biotin-dependent carboxyltransferase family protein [Pseudomonadota bacterium]
MTEGLKILSPGVHTTVQDFGRFGYQGLGVPVSGALDTESLRLANGLVGNPSDMAGLEILHHGPELEVLVDSIRIAVGGFGVSLNVLGDDAANVPAWQSIRLSKGQTFRITLDGTVLCCYLAVEGGFDLEPCLGSLSTYTRAGFGGYHGRILKAGDILPIKVTDVEDRDDLRLSPAPQYSPKAPIRVTWGLQQDYFTNESLKRFVSEPFTIHTDADRMGCRIFGPSLEHKKDYDIVSDGIATGAIQVPGNGHPIILLSDHQTTGGYPKIATVISADLPGLGRRKPGNEIRFAVIEVEQAEDIRRDREASLQKIEKSMEPVPNSPRIDLRQLYESNIISGVVMDEED